MHTTPKVEPPVVTEDSWQPFATFVIEFQQQKQGADPTQRGLNYRTHAHLVEGGKDANWPGIEGKEVLEWVLRHVALNAQQKPHVPNRGNSTEIIEFPVKLRVKKITVTDNLGHQASCEDSDRFFGYVSHNGELSFRSNTVMQGALLQREHFCRTDFYALNLSDGSRRLLGSAERMVVPDHNRSIRTELSGIHLESGVYAIRAITIINSEKPSLDYLEGSLLIVA